jgi:hypothetical protein
MRSSLTFSILAGMLVGYGCDSNRASRQADVSQSHSTAPAAETRTSGAPASAKPSYAAEPMLAPSERAASGGGGGGGDTSAQMIPISDAELTKAAAEYAERKVIRNATLSLEVDNPTDTQARLTSVAESHGGFVVSSDFKRTDTAGQPAPTVTVTVVLRVPSSQFGPAVSEIRAFAGRVKDEKTTGQDVTEEYIDLEARLRTKKALEAQFLEIMKQAHKISDALEVQSQIADVRADIERIEGRRRFLENQSALSTITVSLQTPAPLIATTKGGFRDSVAEAFGDCVDTGAAVVIGLIRIIGVMIPVTLLVLLPVGLLMRVLLRRFKFEKKPEPQLSIK